MRIELVEEKKEEKNCYERGRRFEWKEKIRREIEVEKVTKVSDVMTRISGKVDGWENVEDHWKGDAE